MDVTNLGGLIFDEDGRPMGTLPVGFVLTYKGGRIQDNFVVFKTRESLAYYSPEPTRQLLSEFIGLATDDGARIEKFARRHGALGLCKHGWPLGHYLRSGQTRCYDRELSGHVLRERLDSWRRLAVHAASIMKLAASLAEGKPGSRDAWAEFGSEWLIAGWAVHALEVTDVREGRQRLARAVSILLMQAEVVPRIEWDGRQPSFGLTSHTLIGVIGVALLSTLLRSRALATCAACGQPYLPKRKPQEGRLSFCAGCGKGGRGSKRLSARARRQSERDGVGGVGSFR